MKTGRMKGFAVAAAEVRKPAERRGKAADEPSGLSSSSVQAAEQVTKAVQQLDHL